MLPPRLPKKPKRATRWKSQAHRDFVRSHACCKCGSTAAIEFAHVRLGSGAGMGQKPDDWRGVSLCHDCHTGDGTAQHNVGERTFWNGIDYEALIAAFIQASPRRHLIKQAMKERGL
ncbi:hypothetical protein JMG10_13250 [Nostoc ellipsosporum NOK]|nr:hypothetical protein [Nostoc ellipsosporum NOK]